MNTMYLITSAILLLPCIHAGDDSSRAGKIAGAVCGAVGVAATVGIVVWVVRGSPHAFCESKVFLFLNFNFYFGLKTTV